jgi:hypothetical protein
LVQYLLFKQRHLIRCSPPLPSLNYKFSANRISMRIFSWLAKTGLWRAIGAVGWLSPHSRGGGR